jgi:hypothetical protein
MRRLALIAAALLASAAALSAEPIQISPNTYLITAISRAGVFANLSKLKVKVLQQANDFAKKKGLIAVPVSFQEREAGGPGQWPKIDYQFRLVAADDPAAANAILLPRADVVVESRQDTTGQDQAESANDSDLYTELTKLDDLRKRGLLTDAEFDVQKKKLLQKQR